jgi:hypothetical protein
VLRPIDAVTTKPETSSAAELQTLQVQQVASIQSDIPRIHAAQPLFASIVERDLRLAISGGLDELVRVGVNTAGTAAAVTGNVLDKVRKAKTVVEGQGYNRNVLAIDPEGAEQLDLLKTAGSEQMYVFNAGAAAPAPYGLQVRGLEDARYRHPRRRRLRQDVHRPAGIAQLRAGLRGLEQAAGQARNQRRLRGRADRGRAADPVTCPASRKPSRHSGAGGRKAARPPARLR